MIAALVMAVFLSGCKAPDATVSETEPGKPKVEHGRNGTIAYYVEIEADEPGVKIEADNEFIGEAPVTLKIFGDPDGTFHNFGSYEYVIRALPTKPGHFMQVKTFKTGGWSTSEDRIPKRIYFDTRLQPVSSPEAVQKQAQ
jgi:hypothetical protein